MVVRLGVALSWCVALGAAACAAEVGAQAETSGGRYTAKADIEARRQWVARRSKQRLEVLEQRFGAWRVALERGGSDGAPSVGAPDDSEVVDAAASRVRRALAVLDEATTAQLDVVENELEKALEELERRVELLQLGEVVRGTSF